VGPTHPKPVIDALLAMEIGLAYILTLMWKAYRERAKGVDKLSKLASKIRALAHPTPVRLVTEAMNVGYDHGELCKALCILDKKYSPKWRKLIDQQLYVTEKIVEEEIGAVSSVLKALSSYDKKGADGLAHRDALADEIERNSTEANYLTYFDIVYLLLNFIAFYGYLLGVLAFYYPEYVNGVKAGPIWVKQLMFNMTDSDADWWGVLAGDLAWTIEPMLILLQPTVISGLLPAPAAPAAEKKQKPKATKAKAASEAAAASTAASKVVPAASPSKGEGEGATWKEMPTPRQDAADAVGESDEGDKKNK
jgi:hypothetical protein